MLLRYLYHPSVKKAQEFSAQRAKDLQYITEQHNEMGR